MNLITDEFKSSISTSSEYGKKVENISVNENHGGVQLKISFKNGTSASCINTGYGSEEGLWKIMP